MTKSEKAQVTEAILKQKVVKNKKVEALYIEHRERQAKAEGSEEAAKAFAAQGNKILFRIARVATGTFVRWNRNVSIDVGNEMQTGDADKMKDGGESVHLEGLDPPLKR